MPDILTTIALSLGVAWASGLNLYATILVLGLFGATGHLVLPDSLTVLQNPLVIGAAALMYLIEFFADKIPGIDSGWDTLHTFVRIPAGAILAAAAVAEVDPALTLAAGLVGGGLSASTHLTKAGTRLLLNTSPEPFSNAGASLAEDGLVAAGLCTALFFPAVFLVLLLVFLAFVVWWLPRVWRGLKGMRAGWRRLFRTERPRSLPHP